VKAQIGLVLDEEADVQRIAHHLMATHHNPAKPQKGSGGADPFVIALAEAADLHCVVVVDEYPDSLENRKKPLLPAMPKGCSASGFSISCSLKAGYPDERVPHLRQGRLPFPRTLLCI
jgi:hypothetical protein